VDDSYFQVKVALAKTRIVWEGPNTGKCVCDICGLPIEPPQQPDLHHAFLKRSNGLPDELINAPENCCLVHHQCHMNLGQAKLTEIKCWQAQCRRYGESHMSEWWASVATKAKTPI
jgi:hypothetical protein